MVETLYPWYCDGGRIVRRGQTPVPLDLPAAASFTLLDSSVDALTVANPISAADMYAFLGSSQSSTIGSSFPNTRVVASAGHGNVLEHFFAAGKYGSTPPTGTGIVANAPLSRAVEEASIEYDVKFPVGFPFKLGGKLPGLGGRVPGTGNPPTGGTPSPQGWSGRGMWITPAAGYGSESPQSPVEWIGYVYDPTQPASNYGQNRRTGKVFVPGQWHHVKQTYRMNSIAQEGVSGNPDGVHRMFFDGFLCFEKKNQVFRIFDSASITTLMWHTFFGGNDTSWAPATDCTVQFDNLLITTPEAP